MAERPGGCTDKKQVRNPSGILLSEFENGSRTCTCNNPKTGISFFHFLHTERISGFLKNLNKNGNGQQQIHTEHGDDVVCQCRDNARPVLIETHS